MSDKCWARQGDTEAVTVRSAGRPVRLELFVKGQEVWFSEVSPASGRHRHGDHATQAQNEFELHVAPFSVAVARACGRPGASAVIYVVSRPRAYVRKCHARLRLPESQLAPVGSRWPTSARRMGVALPPDTVEPARKRARNVPPGAAGALTANDRGRDRDSPTDTRVIPPVGG